MKQFITKTLIIIFLLNTTFDVCDSDLLAGNDARSSSKKRTRVRRTRASRTTRKRGRQRTRASRTTGKRGRQRTRASRTTGKRGRQRTRTRKTKKYRTSHAPSQTGYIGGGSNGSGGGGGGGSRYPPCVHANSCFLNAFIYASALLYRDVNTWINRVTTLFYDNTDTDLNDFQNKINDIGGLAKFTDSLTNVYQQIHAGLKDHNNPHYINLLTVFRKLGERAQRPYGNIGDTMSLIEYFIPPLNVPVTAIDYTYDNAIDIPSIRDAYHIRQRDYNNAIRHNFLSLRNPPYGYRVVLQNPVNFNINLIETIQIVNTGGHWMLVGTTDNLKGNINNDASWSTIIG